jgi:outer membrane protein TolC
VREARSQYFPTVSVGGSYTRSQTSSNVGSATGSGHNGGKQSQLFSLPGRCFVGARSLGESAQHGARQPIHAQLTAADLENERLTEQASLAEYFFEIRGQDALQQILNDTVEADKKAVEACRLL